MKTKVKKVPGKQQVKLLDYLVIFFSPIIAAAITIYFNTNQVISLILFFILPSIYFTIRNPFIFKKALVPVLCSIPFVIIVDHFAIKDGSWWVYTIFPFRVLNNIPVEDFIWSASWFYFIIAFYESFIDQAGKEKDGPPDKKRFKVLLAWLTVGLVFLLFYNQIDKYISIPYFYAIFALVLGLIPLIFFVTNHPKIVSKFALTMVYFFFVNFLHEISALSANQWIFPGSHFVGWIQIFDFRFPFEEFTLWMLLGSSYILTWYEYFVDNKK